MKRPDHHKYFMKIASVVAQRSSCISRQVGCVLVDDHNHILSTGYNGPPSKIDHCVLCRRKESGRDLYDCMAVHAEMNALLQCKDVNQIASAYITVSPCAICMRLFANTSCRTIIFKEPYTIESFRELNRFWQGRLRRTIVKVK